MKEEINYINTNAAMVTITQTINSSISLPTLIKWIEKYHLGNKLGGRWRIDKNKLIEMLKKGNLDGKKKA